MPSLIPSQTPTFTPSSSPSYRPTTYPSEFPTSQPSSIPSENPTLIPSSEPSINPSDFPSLSPSVCVDEPNWTTFDPNGTWSGKTCTQIGELLFWCSYLAQYTNQGKSTYEACCFCGGGDHIPSAPSKSPSIVPSVSPSQCVDDPDWYWDVSNGYGCNVMSASFCSDPNVNVWYNGKNAYSACCICGGGDHTGVEPSSIPSSIPSSSPVKGNLPGFLTESTEPSITPACSINDFIGQQVLVPFGSSCYRIEFFQNGVLALDATNVGCSNQNFVDTAILSIFDYATSDEAIFKEGDLGWTGQFRIEEDSTVTDIGVGIESLDLTLRVFDINLLFSSCYEPSTFPSNEPSISIEPSYSPTECINESNWYWDVKEGYGCDQLSISFCDVLSAFWHNDKNALSACCICGGGAQI